MIKLTDILNEIEEGLFDKFFKTDKPQQAKPTTKAPELPKESSYIVDGLPITIEGVYDGYDVYKGNDPMGDMRGNQTGMTGKTTSGVLTNKKTNLQYAYHYIGDLDDRVGRPKAYLSVSTRVKPGMDVEAIQSKLKSIAETIVKRAIKDFQLNPSLI